MRQQVAPQASNRCLSVLAAAAGAALVVLLYTLPQQPASDPPGRRGPVVVGPLGSLLVSGVPVAP
ncbi:MAG: hypothetical protein ABI912_11185 [Actinomycetota bacterium]